MRTPIEETVIVELSGATTIPQSIRQLLGIERGGKIVFRVETYGRVSVKRADPRGGDPLAQAFLELLQEDIVAGGNVRDLPARVSTAMRNALAGRESP